MCRDWCEVVLFVLFEGGSVDSSRETSFRWLPGWAAEHCVLFGWCDRGRCGFEGEGC